MKIGTQRFTVISVCALLLLALITLVAVREPSASAQQTTGNLQVDPQPDRTDTSSSKSLPTRVVMVSVLKDGAVVKQKEVGMSDVPVNFTLPVGVSDVRVEGDEVTTVIKADTLIISLYEPYEQVGLYTLAYRMLELTLVFGTVFLTTVTDLSDFRRRESTLIATAGYQSNFCRALAGAGAKAGLACHLHLRKEVPIAVMLKNEFCVVRRLSDDGIRLDHRARSAVSASYLKDLSI